jgi:hypothetical protein
MGVYIGKNVIHVVTHADFDIYKKDRPFYYNEIALACSLIPVFELMFFFK